MAGTVAAGRRGARRGTPGGRRTAATEAGAVTAETAAVLPLLVAVALALVWLVTLAAAQVRVVDAAREVARLAARGEDVGAAVDRGRQVAPAGADVDVRQDREQVTVAVAAEVHGPGGLLAFLPGVEVRSKAVAAVEPR